MSEDSFTVEITKKDKIYLSVIMALVVIIVCLAICLPRPYKVVEKEVVVYQPVINKVYDIKREYIIHPDSNLISGGKYEDRDGNLYKLSASNLYMNVGNLTSIKTYFNYENGGLTETKVFSLTGALAELIVSCDDGVVCEIKFDSYIMENVKTLFTLNLGENVVGALEDFMFEIEFEKATINFIVSYISE